MLKDLLGDTLQGMLEAEMDETLGYSKYDYKNKETDDGRNGYSPKTVTSSMGEIDLQIPRDRKGEFEPQIVKKNPDNFFVGISFTGFVCALQFLSLLSIYMNLNANPKFELTFLFRAFPTVVSCLYALPFSVVMNNNRK